MIFKLYNEGYYIEKEECIMKRTLKRYLEYLRGVSLPRQIINRIKPEFISTLEGDVIEIGGTDSYFKNRYKKGTYLNLDINDGTEIDLVLNAENMYSIENSSLGGVICISVLEHTYNPKQIISEIYRCLKPGGKAYLSVPWLYQSHMDPNDYYRFSYYLLEEWVSGFIIEKKHFTNSYFGLIAHIFQRNFLLSFTLGSTFFFLDFFKEGSIRWSTQINVILKKI